ncbi:MAG: metallophosphoesterase [Candidatus Binatia bacterium]|nr:MAG: metallophosphoesterase [Candidatus Binatia bacterium]
MTLLFLGDVVGRPGRRAIRALLPAIVEREGVDFVVANCENVSGGAGVDPESAEELFELGVHVLTSGNHVWRRKELVRYIEEKRTDRLLRPANFPEECPGRGWTLYPLPSGKSVAVVNLIGRTFLEPVDCPFRAARAIVERLREKTPMVVVDMHAEATSEKAAMGWYLDGKVSAVFGSHTHVQTADERILPGGTAYLTDAGMCGPRDSVIGVKPEQVVERFLKRMPVRFEPASGPVLLQGVVAVLDEETGKATSVRRIQETFGA